MKFFDDLKIGDRFDMGAYTFSQDEILAFRQRHDPLPVFGADERNGKISASGLHVACVQMRLFILSLQRETEERSKAGLDVALNGPSPGVRDISWPNPVYAGDTMRVSRVLTEMRASASRKGWGLTSFVSTGLNQRGETVLLVTGTGFLQMRPAS